MKLHQIIELEVARAEVPMSDALNRALSSVEEMEQENAQLRADWCTQNACIAEQHDELAKLRKELAAAQAVIEQMREVLQDFSNYVRDEQNSTDGPVQYSSSRIEVLAFNARCLISNSTDDTALRARLRQERERVAQEFDRRNTGTGGFYDEHEPAEIIRNMGDE